MSYLYPCLSPDLLPCGVATTPACGVLQQIPTGVNTCTLWLSKRGPYPLIRGTSHHLIISSNYHLPLMGVMALSLSPPTYHVLLSPVSYSFIISLLRTKYTTSYYFQSRHFPQSMGLHIYSFTSSCTYSSYSYLHIYSLFRFLLLKAPPPPKIHLKEFILLYSCCALIIKTDTISSAI